MSLNIKNERVHALAREAARVTGKSQTSAIEAALELFLAEHGADPVQTDLARRFDLIRSLSAQWIEAPAGGESVRTTDDLYDAETGLPA